MSSKRVSLVIVDRPTALLVSSVAPGAGGGGDVLSVFGRTGAVTAQSGDYSAFYDSAGSAATALSTSQAYTINQIAAITPASIGAATAAQGTLAGTALQPGAIGATVQGYSAVTAAIAALPATANRVFGRDGSGNIALITIGGGGDMLKSIYDTTDNGIVDAAEAVPWTGVTGKPTFATVATSGAYADLSGLPSIPNSPDDIGAQPEDADLTGLAALATTGLVNRTGAGTFTTIDPSSYALVSALGAVAFSNAYSDLTGLPSIPNSPDDIGAQPEDADLTALAALATTGLVNRTGAGTFTTVDPASYFLAANFSSSFDAAFATKDATDLAIDDTNFTVIPTPSPNLQDYLDKADIALLNARSTGLRFGGELTDLGSGVARIGAGAGQILDNTDPSDPLHYSVNWVQTDINLAAIGDNRYWLYVNTAGVVTYTTTEPSHEEFRLTIPLYRVVIRSGQISGIARVAMSSQQNTASIWDVWRALGLVKRDLPLGAASTDLSFKIGAGEIYSPGISENPLEPSEDTVATQNPATFRHIDRNNNQSADLTQLDVTQWDNNGAIETIPNPSSTAAIHTVFIFPGDTQNVRVLRPQNLYTKLVDAFNNIEAYSRAAIIPTNITEGAICLGYIIVTKGTTDLSQSGVQSYFVLTNKFGGIGGAIAANFANFVEYGDIGVSVQAYSEPLTSIDALILTGQTGNALVVNGTEDGYSLADIPDSPDDIGAQPEDADLTAIAAISTTGLLNRTGAGTFATISVGTAANNIFQLDGSARIPAVNGSLLTGLVFSQIGSTPTTLAGYGITDAVPTTRTLTAGTGIATIGDLSANRTVALSAGSIASLALADTAVQPAAIANFETTTQLNTRDTNNRARANHTGTQAISTVSGLQTALDGKSPLSTIAIAADQKNSTTDGGSASSGTVTRTINTTIQGQSWFTLGTDGGLSANQFRINGAASPGTYVIDAEMTCYAVNRCRAILYDITGAAELELGMSLFASNTGGAGAVARVTRRVALTADRTYEIRNYNQTAQATNGLGVSTGDSRTNTYLMLRITKIE